MDTKDFATLHEFVEAARQNLDQELWDYLVGGSETETTLRRNRLALDQMGIVPAVLNDVSEVDTSATILGNTVSMPVVLAPLGSMQKFHPSGGAGAAEAAGAANIMSIASSVCRPGLEEIAAASNATKVYQLYVRGDSGWVDGYVERAIAAGYRAFCFTVDTSVVSRRDRDLAKRASPTSGEPDGSMRHQAAFTWTDVERVATRFDIPLILKGISRRQDIDRALDLGVKIIYLSNHGGRQLDQGVATISMLPRVVEQVDGRAEVWVDGGFYRGTDIIKAVALGANAVGLGRLQGWAIAAGGPAALTRCLEILQEELRVSMALCGACTLAELANIELEPASAVHPSEVSSAFPLLGAY